MLASKSHASLKVSCCLKVPCFYEQIFGGARFARRSLGPAGQASGAHLGDTWKPMWQLGWTWEARRWSGQKVCQNHCVLLCLSSRPPVSLEFWRGTCHRLRCLPAKVDARTAQRHATHSKALLPTPPGPLHRKLCLGNNVL